MFKVHNKDTSPSAFIANSKRISTLGLVFRFAETFKQDF